MCFCFSQTNCVMNENFIFDEPKCAHTFSRRFPSFCCCCCSLPLRCDETHTANVDMLCDCHIHKYWYMSTLYTAHDPLYRFQCTSTMSIKFVVCIRNEAVIKLAGIHGKCYHTEVSSIQLNGYYYAFFNLSNENT